MWMTKEEIARSYRNSRRRSSQINILADLNLCTAQEIKEVLIEMGEVKGPKKEKLVEKKVEKVLEEEEMKVPEVILQLAEEKMDSLEAELKILEQKQKVLEEQYNQIAAFLDGKQ